MPKTDNQKQKLLAVRDILLEHSDEEHWLTADDIIAELDSRGISAERKSIYSDIAALNEAGMDIIQRRGAKGGYFVGSRDFELPEVKLLVDAVQFCRFITPNKSRKLVNKLSSLCSEHQARELGANIWVNNSGKSDNESILANIDAINEAVRRHLVISFKYYKWTVDFKGGKAFTLQPLNNGNAYIVQPYGLIWDDENYYLAAIDRQSGEMRHFRLDRIRELAVGDEHFRAQDLDLQSYVASHFNMMGGELCKVRLQVHNDLAAVLVDKYGIENLMPMPYNDEYFVCVVNAVISPQFFGWLASFGGRIKLLSPEEQVKKYRQMLSELAADYE